MTGAPTFSLEKIIRPNILTLEPYRCARDDFTTGVLLDANENTHGPCLSDLAKDEAALELNRYPDPHQVDLKKQISDFRNLDLATAYPDVQKKLTPANLYVGVGSDECIDSIIRLVCVPGKDKILTCPPTYGMYSVSAQVNDVGVVEVLQDDSEFPDLKLNIDKIMQTLSNDPSIKIVFIPTPGNPAPSVVEKDYIFKILQHPVWRGLVVADEAYIDFTPPGTSMAPYVNDYPNLLVTQTLSKAFGLAGARLGFCFATPEIARLFNAMKAPYNVSTPASNIASRSLSKDGLAIMKNYIEKIATQRDRTIEEFAKIPGVGAIVGGGNANFVLAQILDGPNGKPSSEVSKELFLKLANHGGVVVRYRGTEPLCTGCLRISIGTEEETTTLIKELREALQAIYESRKTA